ncbi:MAG: hypothetical protein COA78_12425 [Blastopirellula sp.]|nr:MAG: hypothetical protein COA78_12425 [Blastopirellula sp.]
MNSSEKAPVKRSFLRSLGPAVIVASVVLGPGSILTNSKVGTQFGYSMIWVLVSACVFMFAAASMSARLGVVYDNSFCTELRNRLGRPFALVTGISIFLIATCFQFTNNLGVLAAVEPLLTSSSQPDAGVPLIYSILILGLLNGLIIAVLFGLKHLYKPLEKVMMVMVGIMILVFVTNIFFAGPSIEEILMGLKPSWPADDDGQLLPIIPELSEKIVEGKLKNYIYDPIGLLVALMATTFSVAGAFYQGYLVKEKGWKLGNLKQGMIDSFAGIFVLGGISLVIMVTSAAVLHGSGVKADDLKSVTAVAQQLKPLLGDWGNMAEVLFCVGIFAGAFSSFMVNAMIGGVMLSDGLGYDCKLDSISTKVCTTIALVFGMIVAVASLSLEEGAIVPLIILGQGMTVIGVPILAVALLYLATRPELIGERKIPNWMIAIVSVGAVLVLILAIRTSWVVFLKITLLV